MSVPGNINQLQIGAAASGGGSAGIVKSVRFNDDDSAYLNRTPSSEGNTKTWTWSCWVKRSKIGSIYPALLSAGANSGVTGFFQITFEADEFSAYMRHSGGTYGFYTDAQLKDTSAWYHLVVALDTTAAASADRLKMYINGVEQTFRNSSTISQDTTFLVNSTALHQIGATKNIGGTTSLFQPGYLADLYLIDGQALDPTSFGAFDDNGVWQSASYSGAFGTNGFHLFDFANESGVGNDSSGNNNDWTVNNITNSPDTTSWPGYLFTSDSTYDGTSTTVNFQGPSNGVFKAFDGSTSTQCISNVGGESYIYFRPTGGFVNPSKVRIYASNVGEFRINGSVVTTSPSAGSSAQWYEVTSTLPSTVTEIAHNGESGVYNARVYAYEIDDEVLTFTGGAQDVLFDVPVNGSTDASTGAGGEVSANYCTFNPLANFLTLTDGNLNASQGSAAHHPVFSTFGMSSGKFYWEYTKNDSVSASSTSIGLGVTGTSFAKDGSGYISSTVSMIGYVQSGLGLYDGTNGYTRLVTIPEGEHKAGVWMLAYDFDNNKGWIGRDGVWFSDTSAGNEGDPANGTNPCFTGFTSGETYVPMLGMYAACDVTANFGQRKFIYDAPAGFKAPCTSNLSTPTIPDGQKQMDVVLYSSTGTARTISGLGFAPDWVWSKRRSASARHVCADTVRGATNDIFPNLTNVERVTSDGLTSFTSDGYELGADTGQYGWQANGQTFVNWAWNAGTTTSSNTDGNITSQVRANLTAGFSIVSWTASGSSGTYNTIGHGLGASPGLVITKRRDIADSWYSAHGFDLTEFGTLNNDTAFATAGAAWGDGITSSVIGMRIGNFCANGDDMIAYCFTPVEGYSMFGTYEGNGSSSDGPFVYTGFRPAWVMYKRTDSTSDWFIDDYKRLGYNFANKNLYANDSGAESTGSFTDFLSNGFKLRAGSPRNVNTASYLFAAFAENPFQANGGLAR